VPYFGLFVAIIGDKCWYSQMFRQGGNLGFYFCSKQSCYSPKSMAILRFSSLFINMFGFEKGSNMLSLRDSTIEQVLNYMVS
jgi:hypothetical protein